MFPSIFQKAAVRKRLQTVLRTVFGLRQLRPGQQKAVRALLSGRDVVCVMPTGAGKSLCYQLPALLLEGCALVVSPLIALMQDQVRSLRARGVPAACLTSLQLPGERQAILDQYLSGHLKLLYVAPERLTTPAFRQLLSRRPPSLLAVDEAHCVVQWGASFRPDYQQLGDVLDTLPTRPPVCAMTATADRRIRRQLASSLHLRRPCRVDLPLLRPNLRYEAVWTCHKDTWLLSYLRRHPAGRGIIFCRSRARTESLAARLNREGLRCAAYHARMPREERLGLQEAFTTGSLRLLCATSAFGLGVDLPDVRFVLLDAPPDNMLDLAQQLGRAGRDGAPADCVVLTGPRDMDLIRRHLYADAAALPRLRAWRARRQRWAQQRSVLSWCLGGRCLSAALTRAFGHRSRPCGTCAVCRLRASGKPARLARVPRLGWVGERGLQLWSLRTERAALARELGASPRQLLPDALLRDLLRGDLPEDAPLSPAVRLHMNQARRML